MKRILLCIALVLETCRNPQYKTAIYDMKFKTSYILHDTYTDLGATY